MCAKQGAVAQGEQTTNQTSWEFVSFRNLCEKLTTKQMSKDLVSSTDEMKNWLYRDLVRWTCISSVCLPIFFWNFDFVQLTTNLTRRDLVGSTRQIDSSGSSWTLGGFGHGFRGAVQPSKYKTFPINPRTYLTYLQPLLIIKTSSNHSLISSQLHCWEASFLRKKKPDFIFQLGFQSPFFWFRFRFDSTIKS